MDIHIPDRLYAALKTAAEGCGCYVDEWITRVLKEDLEAEIGAGFTGWSEDGEGDEDLIEKIKVLLGD